MKLSIYFVCLAILLGCGAQPTLDNTPSVQIENSTPQNKTDSARDTSQGILLTPSPSNQYRSWQLTNDSDVIISRGFCDRLACGYLETKSYLGRWVVAIPSHGDHSICVLHPGESSVCRRFYQVFFPAGTYRYVVDYREIALPHGRNRLTVDEVVDHWNGQLSENELPDKIVSAEFTIQGKGKDWLAERTSLIEEMEAEKCPDVLDWVIKGVGHFSTSAELPYLLKSDVKELRTHRNIVEQVFRVADYQHILTSCLDGDYGPLYSLGAALYFARRDCPSDACGYTIRNCSMGHCRRVIEILAKHLSTESEYLYEIVLALRGLNEQWPEGTLDRLTELLVATTNEDLRELIFFVLTDITITPTISEDTKRKITVARKKAIKNETRASVKSEMQEVIQSEAEGFIKLGYIPQPERKGFQKPDLDKMSERCKTVYQKAKQKLSFPGVEIPPTSISPAVSEPYNNRGLPHLEEWAKEEVNSRSANQKDTK